MNALEAIEELLPALADAGRVELSWAIQGLMDGYAGHHEGGPPPDATTTLAYNHGHVVGKRVGADAPARFHVALIREGCEPFELEIESASYFDAEKEAQRLLVQLNAYPGTVARVRRVV